MQLRPDEIVEHDNIRSGSYRLVAFFCRLTFHIHQERKARYAPDRLDGIGD